MDKINYYRYASNPQHRTADGTETLPKKIDKTAALRLADAVNTALANNVPGANIAAKHLLTHILAEGRDDAGVNEYNTNNPRAAATFKEMQRLLNYEVHGSSFQSKDVPAMYIAATQDKAETAKRLNKPFAEVWNGTGRSAVTGRTGAQHANRFADAEKAAASTKNTELRELLQRVITQGATQAEQFDMRRYEIQRALARNFPDAGYRTLFEAGSHKTEPAIRQVLQDTSRDTVDYNIPALLTNILAATAGATPRKIPTMSANTQTELEIALSAPGGRELLSRAGILPK